MTFTLGIEDLPCSHVILTVTTGRGKVFRMPLTKDQFHEELDEEDIEGFLIPYLRATIRDRGLNTMSKIVTALDGKTFTV
jgi:hypothetical protein